MIFYSLKAKPTFLASLFSASILSVLAFFLLLPSGYGSYASTQSCVPPPLGIIAWWPLDETSGTTAGDIVGNSAGIHVNGPVPAVGHVEGALRFDGVDDYIGVGDSDHWAFGSNDFTIELWADFTSPGGGTTGHPSHIFIGNDEGSGSQNKWFFALGGGFLNFHLNSPTIGPKFFPLVPFSPNVNQWYHLAVTRNGSTFTIFINGIPAGSEINTDVIPNPNAPLTIGQAESLGFMNGLLDEVTIYNRALTHGELQAIFDSGSDGKCKAFSIATKNLAAVQLGEAASQTLQSAFGTPSVSWALSDGILPLGMSLSTDGVLAGIPLEAGTFVLTIRATDAEDKTAERTFTLTVFLNLPPPEISVQIAGTVPVPGRALDYFVVVENVGTTRASNVNVHALVVPNQFTFLSADPAPAVDDPNTLFDPNTVHWLLPELAPGEVKVLTYKARLKSTVPIGSVVTPAAFVNPDVLKAAICFLETIRTAGICTACSLECGFALSCLFFPTPICIVEIPACYLCLNDCPESLDLLIEACYSKNSPAGDSKTQVVRGAVDPNEKVATTTRFIRPDRVLTYPIHFENVGDIEARDVFVTDVLDPNLDASTLSLLTANGGSFDIATSTVKWDLLNRNLGPGETGNVVLSIRPRPGLPSGTVIRNSATIQFEVFNPFLTNEVVNIIDNTGPTSVMNPLPAESSTLDFPISWSGGDAVGEIDFYSILVSVDGGDFTPFLERTRETSTTFRGEVGRTYGFLSIATDTAGNIEVQPATAEATTEVVTGTAQTIACGQTLSGSIDLVAEQDTYTFSGDAGEAVSIAAVATAGSLCARVELYGPTGNFMVGNPGVSCNGIIAATLPTTGTYTILVRDVLANQTGAYNVNLQFTTGRCGTVIDCGQTITISTPIVIAEQDIYIFDAIAGEAISISALATSPCCSLCARVELYGPAGNLIAGNPGVSCNGIISATLPATGAYTILVRDVSASHTGTYNVNLQFTTGRCGTVINCGETITLSTPIVIAEQDSYIFDAIAGEAVSISALATSPCCSLCARVELYGPAGNIIAGNPGVSCNGIISATLPATGTYTILVRDVVASGAGTYNVNLQFTTGRCGMVIDCGETKSGTIPNIAEQDTFIFCGVQDSSVSIAAVATSGSLCARVELYGSAGNFIAGNPGISCNGLISAMLPASGTYTILVRDVVASSTGSYNVNLSCIGPSCCVYSISPADFSFPASGGMGSVNVSTQNNCDWTATSNDAWIIINSGDSGSGNGTVTYTVTAHTDPNSRRIGTLTVAGKTFTVLQGAAFLDVPETNIFYTFIGKLSARGVTLGCGAGNYCPDQPVTREQMAAFIIRALGQFNPPPPFMQRFNDVPPSNTFYAFIEQMRLRQITLGCGDGNYCPADPATREQMAAFLIRALHEAGYTPPAPAMQRFNDVPPTNIFYAHIEELAARQITLGCSAIPPLYCPIDPVTREQMAAFLVRAFDL